MAQQGRNAQTDGRGVFTGVRYHHVFMAGGLLVEFVTKHSGGRMSEILAEKTGMDWYAVQVSVGFEKAAREALEERIERAMLSNEFGEILFPTEKVLDIKKGTKQLLERKLYPGYLFIQMRMSADSEGPPELRKEQEDLSAKCWHLVRRTRRINGFISGTSDKPLPLSAEEIKKIRRQIEEGEGREPTLQIYFATGDHVRIKDGPFVDFSGVVDSVNTERRRLTVLVMVLGRSTPVELDFDQVDKG